MTFTLRLAICIAQVTSLLYLDPWSFPAVVKFRRRARYLEFFVQVMQKALSEGLVDVATEWCDETVTWLVR